MEDEAHWGIDEESEAESVQSDFGAVDDDVAVFGEVANGGAESETDDDDEESAGEEGEEGDRGEEGDQGEDGEGQPEAPAEKPKKFVRVEKELKRGTMRTTVAGKKFRVDICLKLKKKIRHEWDAIKTKRGLKSYGAFSELKAWVAKHHPQIRVDNAQQVEKWNLKGWSKLQRRRTKSTSKLDNLASLLRANFDGVREVGGLLLPNDLLTKATAFMRWAAEQGKKRTSKQKRHFLAYCCATAVKETLDGGGGVVNQFAKAGYINPLLAEIRGHEYKFVAPMLTPAEILSDRNKALGIVVTAPPVPNPPAKRPAPKVKLVMQLGQGVWKGFTSNKKS